MVTNAKLPIPSVSFLVIIEGMWVSNVSPQYSSPARSSISIYSSSPLFINKKYSVVMVDTVLALALKPSTKELVFARQSTLFGLPSLRHYLMKSETLSI